MLGALGAPSMHSTPHVLTSHYKLYIPPVTRATGSVEVRKRHARLRCVFQEDLLCAASALMPDIGPFVFNSDESVLH